MPFLTQGKTNWKFIGIVVVLAVIVGALILGYLRTTEVIDNSMIQKLTTEETKKITCEEIDNPIFKNFCFIQTAVDLKDPSICNDLIEVDVETIEVNNIEVSLEYLSSTTIIEHLNSIEVCKYISGPPKPWQDYQDEKNGWGIAIPNNFIVKEHEGRIEFISSEDIIALITPRTYLGEFFSYNFFAIKVIPVEAMMTLESWVGENYKAGVKELPFEEEVIINVFTDAHHPFPFIHQNHDFSFKRSEIKGHIPVIKVKDQETIFGIGLIYAKHDDKIIEFITWGSRIDTPLFDQILSTFRFIDGENKTSDWQTYRNEENGFEFKYPLDYSARELDSIVITKPIGKEGYSAGVKVFLESDRIDGFPVTGGSVQDTSKISFKEFAGYTAREHCFVKGTMGMVSCDEVVKQTPFMFLNMIEGYEIYVNMVDTGVERDEKGGIIETKTTEYKKGPIFALDVTEQTSNKLRGIFFEPYIALSDLTKKEEAEKATENIINQIVSTFRFVE